MTKLTIKKIFVYFLVIVLYFIFIHKLSWYTKEHVDKPKLPGRTEKQIATVGPGTTPTTTIIQTLLQGKYLELPSFKKWLLLKFCILIKKFCLLFNLNQTWSDCSTHEYCNVTKFREDWTEFFKHK